MSKALSLKLDEKIFFETEKVLRDVPMPRNAYINQAIDFYNRLQKRKLLKKKLGKDILLLKDETREWIREFELLEDLPA